MLMPRFIKFDGQLMLAMVHLDRGIVQDFSLIECRNDEDATELDFANALIGMVRTAIDVGPALTVDSFSDALRARLTGKSD